MAILLKPIQKNDIFMPNKEVKKMRETYKKPVADIEKFSTVDVITTSGGGGDEPIVTPPDWDD